MPLHPLSHPSSDVVSLMRTFSLYFVTAIAELLGCYLPLLWVSGKGSLWLLPIAATSLVVFVWLLTLHPAASGRVYAAYGAVYIATAIGWLWLVDGFTPSWRDLVGVGLALAGAAVIASGRPA
jgi:small multidrug resistance family-3 protein